MTRIIPLSSVSLRQLGSGIHFLEKEVAKLQEELLKSESYFKKKAGSINGVLYILYVTRNFKKTNHEQTRKDQLHAWLT